MSRPWDWSIIISMLSTFPGGTHVILLVFVVAHDGDDGVVDEQSQGQDSWEWKHFLVREARRRRRRRRTYLSDLEMLT